MRESENKYKSFSGYFAHFVLIGFVLSLLTFSVDARRPVYDFTGDNRTDFVTLATSSSTTPLVWKVKRNPESSKFTRIFNWGLGGDSITPGDYIGDGKWEPTVWRTGTYYITPFFEKSVPSPTYRYWGQTNDSLARDGDYDGDGKDDHTIIRDTDGRFVYWMQLSGGGTRTVPFTSSNVTGFSSLRFRGADFTGDGRDEFVIAYIENSTFNVSWYIGDSLTGGIVMWGVRWGNFNTDLLVQPDDYTGDGKADLVVWRGASDANWWIRDTATGNYLPPVIFGIASPTFNGDHACQGDYDGDNIADRAVFRKSTREFWWINSTNGDVGTVQWGDAGDTALCTFFVF